MQIVDKAAAIRLLALDKFNRKDRRKKPVGMEIFDDYLPKNHPIQSCLIEAERDIESLARITGLDLFSPGDVLKLKREKALVDEIAANARLMVKFEQRLQKLEDIVLKRKAENRATPEGMG